MSWSIGYDSKWRRDIGYGVPAYCDHPKCKAPINRGLSYVCGSDPYGGEHGCGLFFCQKHLGYMSENRPGLFCPRCRAYRDPYKRPKPDQRQWIKWKLTDESWAQWRREHPDEVAKLKAMKR